MLIFLFSANGQRYLFIFYPSKYWRSAVINIKIKTSCAVINVQQLADQFSAIPTHADVQVPSTDTSSYC